MSNRQSLVIAQGTCLGILMAIGTVIVCLMAFVAWVSVAITNIPPT